MKEGKRCYSCHPRGGVCGVCVTALKISNYISKLVTFQWKRLFVHQVLAQLGTEFSSVFLGGNIEGIVFNIWFLYARRWMTPTNTKKRGRGNACKYEGHPAECEERQKTKRKRFADALLTQHIWLVLNSKSPGEIDSFAMKCQLNHCRWYLLLDLDSDRGSRRGR